jgi:predicted RNA binding protein YcfA (HicA-like mRNA interferase family)
VSGNEKLVRRFLAKKNITVTDCDKVLTLYGYELHKSRGSHKVYHKKGAMPVTIVVPKGTRYVKTPYIDAIIRILKLGD